MQALSRYLTAFEAQRGHLLPWVPVFIGAGIGFYFALPVEPPPFLSGLLLFATVLIVGSFLRLSTIWALPVVAIGLVLFGSCLAALRAEFVGEPVLSFRYYGPIEGRVIGRDKSLSDKPRILLDRVVLLEVAPGRTPARVRVAIHTKGVERLPAIGSTIALSGHLSPPSGPAEPGGFDFQRHAWFQKIGAVGYTRSPVVVVFPAEGGGWRVAIARLRHSISGAVQAALPGDVGGFSAAVLTGDRSGIGRDALDNLRASNLAHLLAISGLHMGLLTGFVFGALRVAMALVPAISLRAPTKKIAAVGALLAGAFYLMLSGGSVATERAFIMASVVFAAVLLDRRALTIRAVALAAVVVLFLRPESIISPGFQMSFAATIALVAAFRAVSDWQTNRVPRHLRPVLGLVLSSVVAGAATAPFGAAHFNQVAHFGLLANTLSVPLMGTIVIPAAVLAAVLAPVGLSWVALFVMKIGVSWILWVAGWVSGLDGALSHVPSPHIASLGLIAFGGLVVVLWQGRGKAFGVFFLIAGFVFWGQVERPPILISGSGGLVGLMTPQGRVLSKPTGDGFAARSWLENDGDPVSRTIAADRVGFSGPKAERIADIGELRIAHLTGKGAAKGLEEICARADVVVTNIRASLKDCVLFDVSTLRKSGSISIYPGEPHKIVTARDRSGNRIWNTKRAKRSHQ